MWKLGKCTVNFQWCNINKAWRALQLWHTVEQPLIYWNINKRSHLKTFHHPHGTLSLLMLYLPSMWRAELKRRQSVVFCSESYWQRGSDGLFFFIIETLHCPEWNAFFSSSAYLMVYSSVPSSVIRSSLFGMVMLWATDFLPLWKKVSGVQILLAIRLFRRSTAMGPLNFNLSSFQLCLKKTSMVYSCGWRKSRKKDSFEGLRKTLCGLF